MSYEKIVLVEPITTLSWPYPAIPNLPTVGDINDIDVTYQPPLQELILRLPAANNVSTGTSIIFNNASMDDFSFTLQDNDGHDLYPFISQGDVLYIYLINNTTTAGIWKILPFGFSSQTASLNQITFTSNDNGLVINPTVALAPTATINFDLVEGLKNLLKVSTIGIPVITKATPLTWNTISLIPGSGNIIITNANGTNGGNVAASPTIDLSTSLTDIDDISVVDVINVPSIQSSATDGKLLLNSVIVDSLGNLTGVTSLTTNALTVTGTITNPSTASAWCSFADPSSGSYPVTVPITSSNGFNVATVTCVNPGVYQVNFPTATPLPNVSYATVATLTRGSGSIAPYQVFVQAQQKEYVSIYTVDTLGNLIPAIYGISVVIFATN